MMVSLIPKKEVVNSFAGFHPITLCNTLYKIFTKEISIRLSKILPKLISVEQGGFVPNRETPEGAIVAHEVLHSISLQRSPTMILKLDMVKAYDRVEWRALGLVLERLGFSRAWIKWIMACISSARFLIIINGSPCGFFPSSRGLRQGDPLSPFLFILLAESFSWAIKVAKLKNLWLGVKILGVPGSISHCLFVDDTLLFGQASMQEALVINEVIQNYASFAG